MKLNELTKYYPIDPTAISAARSYHNENPSYYNDLKSEDHINDDLATTLAKVGWKERSSGHYSMIFTKESEPFILKVNKRQDKPFLWFAFLTRKFPNTHFPKIGNAKVMSIKTDIGKDKFYIYAIERLYPLKDDLGVTVSALCKGIASEARNQNVDPNADYFKDWCDRKMDLITDYDPVFAKQFSKQFESFMVASLILGKYARGYYLDLHSKNIMKREDGTIVISDPYGGIKK